MSARRILITGGTGLVGKALVEMAPAEFEVFATFHRNQPPVERRGRFLPLDVTNAESVAGVFASARPDVVIHTASIGSVDQAEREPTRVRAVNVGGTQAVGQAAAQGGAKFVWISSNAVFDGHHAPYQEEAPVRALNRYGALKIEAEQWVRAHCPGAAIIRPILMYGWPFSGGRGNVVTRWLSRFEQRQPVEVASDIWSMPLLTTNCAEAVWAAVTQDRRGIYHVAGADRVTLAEFARQVARAFGCEERLVMPVPSRRFTGLAPRPADTSFVTTKMERELGIRPMGIVEGLAHMQRLRAAVS